MSKLSSQAKVGLLVVVGIVLLVYVTAQIEHLPFFGKAEGYLLKGFFDTAAGLENKAQIRVAGVEAGKVENIELADGRAVVMLRVKPEIRLHKDSKASIRSLGLLGEKYVEVTPGSAESPLLQDGDTIQAEPALADMEQLANRFGSVVNDIQAVTQSLRKALGGDKGAEAMQRIIDNIDHVTADIRDMVEANRKQVDVTVDSLSQLSRNLNQIVGENRPAFSRTINNAAELSDNLNQIIASNRETINRTLASLEHLSKTLEQQTPGVAQNLNEVLTKANDMLAENRENLKQGIASLKESSRKLDESLGNVNQVTQKISKGEGTLGRLINEDEVYQNLNQGLKGLKDYLKKGEQIKIFIGARSEYLTEVSEAKTYISLRVQPREDKFYLVEVVDDPVGFKRKESTRTKVRDAAGNVISDTTETEETTDEDRLKFSVELAKRFYDFTVRGGMIESKGGLGLDYEPWQNKLKFSVDAWDFGKGNGRNRPHLKFGVNVYVWDPIFVNLGVDDVLDKNQRSFFVGAGFLFSDDDLKALITNVPFRVQQ